MKCFFLIIKQIKVFKILSSICHVVFLLLLGIRQNVHGSFKARQTKLAEDTCPHGGNDKITSSPAGWSQHGMMTTLTSQVSKKAKK